MGSSSLFRVNQQIHDELTQVMLTTQIYVLLVIRGSAALRKALIPSGCKQGTCVQQFKNYNMRISITDTEYLKNKNVGMAATVMVAGIARLQEFCRRVMRDDGVGRYTGKLTAVPFSYRQLFWLVDLKPPAQQSIEVARTKEHVLLTEMASTFSEYKDLNIINLTDTKNVQQAISKMKGHKWTCAEDFISYIAPLVKNGDFAFANGEIDEAFTLYTSADNAISSTLRSPWLDDLLLQQDDPRLRKDSLRYMWQSSVGLAGVQILRAKALRFNVQENAHLAAFYAQRSIDILRRIDFTDESMSRTVNSRAYLYLATGSRYLGQLPRANEAITHALQLLPNSPINQAEAKEIRMAMQSSGVRVSRRISLS